MADRGRWGVILLLFPCEALGSAGHKEAHLHQRILMLPTGRVIHRQLQHHICCAALDLRHTGGDSTTWQCMDVCTSELADLSSGSFLHNEIWKYCQSTSKVHAYYRISECPASCVIREQLQHCLCRAQLLQTKHLSFSCHEMYRSPDMH